MPNCRVTLRKKLHGGPAKFLLNPASLTKFRKLYATTHAKFARYARYVCEG